VVAVHQGWDNVVALGKQFIKGGGTSDPSVTISWREMRVFITGTEQTQNSSNWTWQIFRADASSTPATVPTMDYNSPLGTVAAGTSQTDYTFTDTTVSANKVYYYEVRPVLASGTPNSISIPTNQTTFNIIRMVIPPDNMALVHRWIANQEACEFMLETVDRNNNHRCDYTGPGRDSTNTFFDIERDIMVDVVEAGCNYTDPSTCTVNGCVDALTAATTPQTLYSSEALTNNRIFYDRTQGRCYISGGTWIQVATANIATYAANIDAAVQGLPPLTEVSQADAQTYCAARAPTCDGSSCSAISSAGLFASSNKNLMSRSYHTAAASWNASDASFDTSTEIDTAEDGVNLIGTSATGHCNTNQASGLLYFDTPVPTSPSFIDSLPYTDASGEKKIRTGSTSTQNCKSRYGIQDLVGNVQEWNSDRCSVSGNTCLDTTAADTSNTDLGTPGYDFDGSAVDGPGNSALEDFTFASESNSATHFYVPIGLPVIGLGNGSVAIDSASFPSTEFHNDIYDLNFGTISGTVGIVSGGHSDYNTDQGDGADAGRWSFELLTITATNKDTGFRCQIGVNY